MGRVSLREVPEPRRIGEGHDFLVGPRKILDGSEVRDDFAAHDVRDDMGEDVLDGRDGESVTDDVSRTPASRVDVVRRAVVWKTGGADGEAHHLFHLVDVEMTKEAMPPFAMNPSGEGSSTKNGFVGGADSAKFRVCR